MIVSNMTDNGKVIQRPRDSWKRAQTYLSITNFELIFYVISFIVVRVGEIHTRRGEQPSDSANGVLAERASLARADSTGLNVKLILGTLHLVARKVLRETRKWKCDKRVMKRKMPRPSHKTFCESEYEYIWQ